MESEVNEPALKYQSVTEERYFAIDQSSLEKCELHSGRLVKSNGETIRHGRIQVNLLPISDHSLKINLANYIPGFCV